MKTTHITSHKCHILCNTHLKTTLEITSKEDVPTWCKQCYYDFILINDLYMFQTFTCPSSGVLIYRLFHCRMWCYALGVVAVVLRSWCVVLCTVCQLVEAIYENKIIVTLFASSWYIFLTYIYDAWSHIILEITFGNWAHHFVTMFETSWTSVNLQKLFQILNWRMY